MIKKCLNCGFLTPTFLVNVLNVKVDIISSNNKRRNLCRGGGGGFGAAKLYNAISSFK